MRVVEKDVATTVEKNYSNNNIVHDAFYLIKLFNDEKRVVTQLHVQKLMFLFEAYYMNKYDKNNLYNCNYQAWAFGPVAIPLYDHFKKYGRENIILTTEEKKIADSISEKKKETLKEIYEIFKEFTAIQLVNFTHAEGSPWKIAWTNKEYSIISKEKIKEWFKQYINE